MKPKSVEPLLHRITRWVFWTWFILWPGLAVVMLIRMAAFPWWGIAPAHNTGELPLSLILSGVGALLCLVWLSLWTYRCILAFRVRLQAGREANGR